MIIIKILIGVLNGKKIDRNKIEAFNYIDTCAYADAKRVGAGGECLLAGCTLIKPVYRCTSASVAP